MAKRTGKRATAWKHISRWTRLKCSKNGYVRCITCGKWISVKEAQAGHYLHGDELDFEENNLWPECKKCNYYDTSRSSKAYHDFMLARFGQEYIDRLYVKKKLYCKISDLELDCIIAELKGKIKNFEIENGVKWSEL